MESAEFIGKKHSIVYIRMLLGTAFWVGLLLLLATVKDIRPYSQWVLLLVGLVLLSAAFRWLELRSIAWVVTAEDVIVQGGWLPWKKYRFEIPINSVFEAYYSIGFLAKLLNYGHCTLRRTEGTTSSFSVTYLARARELTGLINQKVKQYRKRQEQPAVKRAGGDVDELKDLASLKANGSITGAEYETMKQRIITRATAP
ncbi:MAG: hypothetical protein AUJ00_03045 [Gemmatimonadetes bacterium 13_1_40CM_3_70_6]|nr:MAG: hypothetical protein AUJ00_03045 [Gemmatimonadetes bacterium 13_1_40CM_3_70_6]